MCGIFGFVATPGAPLDNRAVRGAVRSLIELTEPRGREATGVVLVLPSEIAVYRRAMPPLRVLSHPGFERFLDETLPVSGGSCVAGELAMMGHCRLVTNGTQAIESNNQPVLLDRVIGIHNGIITNAADLASDEMNASRIELDSEALFRHIEKGLNAGKALQEAVEETFRALEGEASIAMLDRGENRLVLATNSGCLYFAEASGRFFFSSERHILASFLRRNPTGSAATAPRQLEAGQAVMVPLATAEIAGFEVPLSAPRTRREGDPAAQPGNPSRRAGVAQTAPGRRLVDRTHRQDPLRRCSRCILPASYPFISFDAAGVCNYCHEHVTQVVAGREELLRILDRYRSRDGSPDCIVAFSGGRDSSYGLHLLKTELGMTPIAFTYDWGLVTDLARRNQARICGALGIEHVIRAANIPAQRRYIRKNIEAWLARPRLGMIPIFMSGDKFFYSHARDLRRETGIDLVVFSAGNELERTPFKTGFAGVRENNFSNRLFALSLENKIRLGAYYSWQFLTNPRYFNESLINSVRAFHSTFIGVDDFLYLYNYEPWNEEVINRTLRERYDWEISPESSNTWRIGDGYTAFINYIYRSVAGFSEYDVFRSHQIRDGVIDRETAFALAEEDNRPRLGELREFARLIGFNLEEVLARIDEIPKIRPRT